MKYIITDQGEVRVGGGYHHDLANRCNGRVIAAGHYTVEDGKVEVHGNSIGFGIKSQPEDAQKIEEYLNEKSDPPLESGRSLVQP